MSEVQDSPSMPAAVLAQIASLPQLPIHELRQLWRKLFDNDPPHHIRSFLERRIAHGLQEREYRKHDLALLERNRRRIQYLTEKGRLMKRETDYVPVPGTVLTRDYCGVEHRVTVTADGQYEYRGRVFGSLSKVAREITGTQWSGPLFFGLRRWVPPKPIKGGGRR